MLNDRRKATQQGTLVALCKFESLHQLADGDVFLRRKTGRLLLEIVHYELESTSGFVLGRRVRGTALADGRDAAGLGI